MIDDSVLVNKSPRLDFGRGVYMRHVLGDVYERITQGGTHVEFVTNATIEYEPSLATEFLKSRSVKQ